MNKYARCLKSEFEFINKFENIENQICELDIGSKNKKCILSKEDKSYSIKTHDDFLRPINNSNFRFLNLDNKTIEISKEHRISVVSSHIRKWSPCVSSDDLQTLFKINKWYLGEYDNNRQYFVKLIIPKIEKNGTRFDLYFASHFNAPSRDTNIISVDDEKSHRVFNGIILDCVGKEFIIYELNNMFVLECLSAIEFYKFNKYSRMILASFGFVTGMVDMDYGYFFLCDESQNGFVYAMFDSSFIGSYKTQYSIVNLNKYDYYQHEDLELSVGSSKNEITVETDGKLKELEKNLKPVTRSQFSRICDKMLTNNDFADIIFSIIESNNGNKSLFARGAMYSVILEMITNVISKENEDKLFYIQDKKTRKALGKILSSTAKSFLEENTPYAFQDSPIQKKNRKYQFSN